MLLDKWLCASCGFELKDDLAYNKLHEMYCINMLVFDIPSVLTAQCNWIGYLVTIPML